ncbi:MAG TPA: NAD-dependent epimerase/dehydratase family protein [Bryobacteraceae bacterium]|nr:NAD-dependent epimerase/dehydratase family protein [Bryobacteraceae bacterium]
MRVLVLGATGFLGPAIMERLVGCGHEVTLFHRGGTAIRGDRNHLDRSTGEFRRLRPDVVVDVLGFTERQAQGLVEAFRGLAGRLVVLSSGDVYRANDILFRRAEGPIEPTPLSESSPLRDRLFPYRGMPVPAAYGISWDEYDKILVERVVMSDSRLPATVLRLPMVYGPGDYQGRKRRFAAYLKRMDDGRGAILLDRLTAEWKAPWGFTENVAEAVRLAVEHDRAAGKIYNVCELGRPDMATWVREVAAAAGWAGRIVAVDEACPPPNLPRQLNLAQHLDMDSTKIRNELGYREIVSRKEAIERTVAWDRGHAPEETDPAQYDYAAEDAILGRSI